MLARTHHSPFADVSSLADHSPCTHGRRACAQTYQVSRSTTSNAQAPKSFWNNFHGMIVACHGLNIRICSARDQVASALAATKPVRMPSGSARVLLLGCCPVLSISRYVRRERQLQRSRGTGREARGSADGQRHNRRGKKGKRHGKQSTTG